MKTTLILSTLILFSALMGCSDNLNITEPLQISSAGNQPNHEQGSWFWSCSKLSVSEKEMSNQVTSPSLPGSIRGIKITFKAATNSYRFSNYMVNLSIYETGDLRRVPYFDEGTLIYSQSDPDSLNGYVELNFNIFEGAITDGHGIKLLVSLFQGDEPARRNVNFSYLELSDINIYTYPRN